MLAPALISYVVTPTSQTRTHRYFANSRWAFVTPCLVSYLAEQMKRPAYKVLKVEQTLRLMFLNKSHKLVHELVVLFSSKALFRVSLWVSLHRLHKAAAHDVQLVIE